MALWDKLFTMLGVGSAQLLVSPDDFADEETSKNLQVCVEAILAMGAVPILNENPASTSFSEVRCKPSWFWKERGMPNADLSAGSLVIATL